jgi:hypothetical protein
MHHSGSVNHPSSAVKLGKFPAGNGLATELPRFPRGVAQRYSEKGWWKGRADDEACRMDDNGGCRGDRLLANDRRAPSVATASEVKHVHE